jgi:pimeloyl-ACP methyl ester carboxylesterase
MRSALALLFVLSAGLTAAAAPPGPGYHAKVNVSAPTRLDWTFALSNRSFETAPDGWLPADYDSTKQTYELFVPERSDTKKPYGMVLFVSPGDGPTGFKQFEGPCKELGLLFVSVYGAGNNCPTKKRIRIVLDVLDDVRRQFPIDPDRTYIGGFSGGGRIACAIAFALPEHFGGVLPVCASGDVRSEPYLRQRVRERLSVALLTGETDFNRGEVERLRGPYLKDIGVRQKVWVQPKLGHGVPESKTILEALKWLDEAVPQRAELAKAYPASRAGADSREEQAKALLAEGKARLAKKETLYDGLMQVKGVAERWPGLKAAEEAEKIATEFESKGELWQPAAAAEERRILLARSKALDAYASGDLPSQYAGQRKAILKEAVDYWKLVETDTAFDPDTIRQAKKRIAELEKLLK